MVFNLRDGGKRDLYDLPVRNLHLYAGSREGLGSFHASNCAAHAPAISRNNLHVVFAVKWLQGCQRFGYFHGSKILPESLGDILPFTAPEVYRAARQPGQCN